MAYLFLLFLAACSGRASQLDIDRAEKLSIEVPTHKGEAVPLKEQNPKQVQEAKIYQEFKKGSTRDDPNLTDAAQAQMLEKMNANTVQYDKNGNAVLPLYHPK
jgi:hypothetical protein